MGGATGLDLGLLVQNVMIAATARGLATCPQVSFARFHRVIAQHLALGEHELTVCGMSPGYPQQDAAHLPKLAAFLQQNQLTGAAQRFHAAWNERKQPLPALDAGALADWQVQTRAARARLLAQDTLGEGLLKFVAKNR